MAMDENQIPPLKFPIEAVANAKHFDGYIQILLNEDGSVTWDVDAYKAEHRRFFGLD